ncbi:inositol monophosphatase [Corynebacterium sp. TAE3-ERU12]|uniref:inositol monophosphatase family protein n=1 Tax=Corynebacterium sp. TAE3-ERU12 TaxID=2849491 RepID=UPI001C46AFA1|nr:inositol monophosphatase family protein [Corynebacterium sp. TAE3-ERU12]MBV7295323.1 inositol monophosphatase [Corynebacterium sp. TAE3-ERU12]
MAEHTSDCPVEPSFTELRELARTIAAAAADLVRRRRAELIAGSGAGLVDGTETKSSSVDPVTVVDKESEQHIRDLIAALRPADAVFGEEQGGQARPGGDDQQVRWVVDPIDGTVNFLYGLPAFSVSIAATIGGTAVAGAVADIAHQRVFHAARGAGAAVTLADGRTVSLQANQPADLSQALLGTGFSYDAHNRAQQGRWIAELLPQVRDIRRMGSAALDLCFLADGGLDVFYEHALNEWDYAAGAVIAEEAGVQVCLPDGEGAPLLAAAPSVAEEFFAAVREVGADRPIGEGLADLV